MNKEKEIKFRAWYVGGSMFLPSTDAWFALKNGYIEMPKTYYLMHSLGIKDKNGKEMFEGDIFKSTESNEVFKVENIFPIHRHSHATNIGYYEGKKYRIRKEESSRYDIQDDWMSNPEFYEVIGNIYQNPELLN